MAINCEYVDIIVPIAKINKVYQGGFAQFKADHLELFGLQFWHDDYLLRDGAASRNLLSERIAFWEGLGLKGLVEKKGVSKWVDYCEVFSATLEVISYCDWLVFDKKMCTVHLKGKPKGAVVSSDKKRKKEFYNDIYLPFDEMFLDLYDGYVEDGKPLIGLKEEDVMNVQRTIAPLFSLKKYEYVPIALVYLLSSPVYLTIFLLKKYSHKYDGLQERYAHNMKRIIYFVTNRKLDYYTLRKHKDTYPDAFKEDIPAFLNHCRKYFDKIFLYTPTTLNTEQLSKIQMLIENKYIDEHFKVNTLRELFAPMHFADSHVYESILIVKNEFDRYAAQELGFNCDYEGKNVYLWAKLPREARFDPFSDSAKQALNRFKHLIIPPTAYKTLFYDK